MSIEEDCFRKRTPPPPEGGHDPEFNPVLRATCSAGAQRGRDHWDETEDLNMDVLSPEQSAEADSGPPSASPPQEDSERTESAVLLLLAERLAQLGRHIRNHACGYITAVGVALLSILAVVIIAAALAPTPVMEGSPPIPAFVSWRQHIEDKMPGILLWNHTIGATRRRRYSDTVCTSEGGHSVMCSVTEDRHRLTDSDAIVFDAQRLGSMRVPSKRAGFQLWVFWAQHPPPPMGNAASSSSSLSLQLIAKKFNLTMGYRHDADIVIPYKTWFCNPPSDKPLSESSNNSGSVQTQFKNKKDAAWIHGDCERNRFERAIRAPHAAGDHSSRNITATSTADTIRLRLFSSCGSHQCPSQANCFRHVAEHYHFIVVSFAPECFQSAYEVIYAAFKYDLVPVVLAPPNTSLHVPYDSVVSSAQLQEPGQLAAYLRSLLDNREEYEAYFAWKRTCGVVMPENELCPLCRILWEEPQHQRLHPDVLEWWTRRSLCRDEPLFGLDSAFIPEI